MLSEETQNNFMKKHPSPSMLFAYNVNEEKKGLIPAVTHVDGTARLQTVKRSANPVYWDLIKKFQDITRIPLVLNTSFNENEPIVCTPREAINCFLRTKMDILVLEEFIIRKKGQGLNS